MAAYALLFPPPLFYRNEDSLELLDNISMADHASLAGDTRFDRVTDIASRL